MSKTLTIVVGVFVVLLIAFGIYQFSIRSNQNSGELPKFKLSVNSWVGFGLFYLADEKGFFNDEGIDVDIIGMEDTAQRKSAMIKGDVDAYADTVDLLVLGRAQNVPAVAVMELDSSKGADGILVTNDVNSVQDLKGKKIAVQKNFVGESFLLYVLKKNGVSPNDVQIIDTESGAAGSAFVSGKVDAAVTFEPWLSKAKERKGGGKVLVSSADEPGVVVDILSANESYLKNNPKNIQKVMRAWFKALDYWKNNQTEANQIMAKSYNVTAQEFAEFISGLEWPNYQENLTYLGTQESQGKIYDVANTFSDIFLELGTIKSKPDMAKAIDESLLKNLY